MTIRATGGLDVLQDRVFPYVGKMGVDDALRLAERAEGILLSGRHGVRTLHGLRKLGYDGPALLDPAEYARDQPVGNPAPTLFDIPPDWTRVQKQAGVTALFSTCSAIPPGDATALARALDEGAALTADSAMPVLALLPLPQRWLRLPHIDVLRRAVERASVPLAFALGASSDPLGTQTDIAGFLKVLAASPVPCSLVRADIAALGALAHGALFGAVGVSTTLRHFLPPGIRAGGNHRDRSVRLFVPRLLSFKTAELLASAHDWDKSGILRCHCDVCHGESLARFEDEAFKSSARHHDVLAWGTVAKGLVALRSDLRKGAWRQLCHEAIEAHARLKEESGVAFHAPAHLRAWERFSTTLA